MRILPLAPLAVAVAACSSFPSHVLFTPQPAPVVVVEAQDAGFDAGPPVSCGADVVVTGALFEDATDRWNLGPPHPQPSDAGVLDGGGLDGGGFDGSFPDGGLADAGGYDGLVVTGNRISVADLDGDGYPDLVVHAISSNAEESRDGGAKLVWQLMNRPRPGGGRMFVDATDFGFFQKEDGGTDAWRSAQLAVFADVDNDGDLDGFSGTYVDPTHPTTDPGDRSELMLNDGTGHFSLAPPTVAHTAEKWPLTSATFTDVDRDGRVDLFIGYWYEYYGSTYHGLQAQLYRGHRRRHLRPRHRRQWPRDSVGRLRPGPQPPAGLRRHRVRPRRRRRSRADGERLRPRVEPAVPERRRRRTSARWGRTPGSPPTRTSTTPTTSSSPATARCTPPRPTVPGVAAPRCGCPTPADSYWAHGVDDQPWRLGGNTFTTLCADLDDDGEARPLQRRDPPLAVGQVGDPSRAAGQRLHRPVSCASRGPTTRRSGSPWPHLSCDWNEGGLMAAAGDLDIDGRQDLVVADERLPRQVRPRLPPAARRHLRGGGPAVGHSPRLHQRAWRSPTSTSTATSTWWWAAAPRATAG